MALNSPGISAGTLVRPCPAPSTSLPGGTPSPRQMRHRRPAPARCCDSITNRRSDRLAAPPRLPALRVLPPLPLLPWHRPHRARRHLPERRSAAMRVALEADKLRRLLAAIDDEDDAVGAVDRRASDRAAWAAAASAALPGGRAARLLPVARWLARWWFAVARRKPRPPGAVRAATCRGVSLELRVSWQARGSTAAPASGTGAVDRSTASAALAGGPRACALSWCGNQVPGDAIQTRVARATQLADGAAFDVFNSQSDALGLFGQGIPKLRRQPRGLSL